MRCSRAPTRPPRRCPTSPRGSRFWPTPPLMPESATQLRAGARRLAPHAGDRSVRRRCPGVGDPRRMSGDECPAFGLLRDTSRVSINLRERAFDQHVSRHAAGWGTRAGTPVAAASAPAPPLPLGAPSPLASSSTSGPIFPSAASIPAISIMNVEPTGTVQPGAASAPAPPAAAASTATAEPIANPPTPPRRPPRRPPTPAAAPAGPPPPAQ